MLRYILVIALCGSLISCKGIIENYKRSNSGVSAIDKKVLYDFRNTAFPAPPAIPAATQKQVLGAIPPASCPVSPNRPARTPHVAAAVPGSFTYAAESEIGYLVTGLPCGSGNKLLVFSAGKLQASADTAFSSILRVFDLNHDDKNELLLRADTTKEGVLDREASLVDFEKNVLHPVEDFGTVYHNSCALFTGIDKAKKEKLIAGGRSPYVEAVVIYYLPHPGQQMPSFTAERYRAACPASPGAAPSGWERIGMR